MSQLDALDKVRPKGTRGGGKGNTLKSRNKLFGEFAITEFLNDENQEQHAEVDTFIDDDIKIDKKEKYIKFSFIYF